MVEAEADTFKEGQEIKPGELPPGWRSFIGRHQTVYNSFTAKLIFDGKRSRKAIQRTTIDFNNSVMHHVEDRVWQRDAWDLPAEQPDANYVSAVSLKVLGLESRVQGTTLLISNSTNQPSLIRTCRCLRRWLSPTIQALASQQSLSTLRKTN